MNLLDETVGMIGFLLVPTADLAAATTTRAALADDGAGDRSRRRTRRSSVSPIWDAATIEAALRAALVDGLGLKPKVAFTPVRVAVTGRRVSPPLFESIEVLGRDGRRSPGSRR